VIHRASVAGGVAIGLLGGLLLLDQLSVLELDWGWTLPAVLATLGVVLVAAGLDDPRRR
jgi:uncharacterized membrane protein